MKQLKQYLIKTLLIMLYALRWFIIIFAWVLFIAFWMLWLIFPYVILLYIILPLIIVAVIKLNAMKFLSYAQSNTILFGGRGSGKSLTQHYLILKDNGKNKPMSNIDYGYNQIVNTHLFYEHITPNTSRMMINNTLKIVKKIHDFEQVNYYWDDTNAYAPNTEDSYLKQYYKSMNLFILIQRHLYDSYTVLNAQDLERMYKNLRELQLDGYIKALGVYGKTQHYIWNRLPILRKYMRVKVRYFTQYESALKGRLPFEKLGLINNTLHLGGLGYTATPNALKMQYEAENGVIKDFALWMKKKDIRYDTREYHKHFFGYPSPTTQHVSVNLKKSIPSNHETQEKEASQS